MLISYRTINSYVPWTARLKPGLWAWFRLCRTYTKWQYTYLGHRPLYATIITLIIISIVILILTHRSMRDGTGRELSPCCCGCGSSCEVLPCSKRECSSVSRTLLPVGVADDECTDENGWSLECGRDPPLDNTSLDTINSII